MHTTSKDGTKIGFDRSGTGPTVILVAGATQYRANDHITPKLAELLAARGFTVFNFDRRGRGASGDTLPYAVEREIEDIAALIEIAGGTASLFGMSSGAILTLEASARLSGVTKAVAYEPPLNPGQPSAESWRLLREMQEMSAGGETGKMMATFIGQFLPPEQLNGLMQSPAWAGLASVGHTIAYDYTIIANATDDDHLPERWRAIKAPVLLLTGGDTFPFMHAGAEWAMKVIPGARHEIIPGLTHEFDPVMLAPVLVEFFSG
ncbi:MAG: alpha/beta hydrolase [Sphingomonadales bacterium]|nr:MAG: alpha/beta hydrolase [Sphingomonadales bacterium]